MDSEVFVREWQRTPLIGVYIGRCGCCAALGWAKDVGVNVVFALISWGSVAFRVRALWHFDSLVYCVVCVLRLL